MHRLEGQSLGLIPGNMVPFNFDLLMEFVFQVLDLVLRWNCDNPDVRVIQLILRVIFLGMVRT